MAEYFDTLLKPLKNVVQYFCTANSIPLIFGRDLQAFKLIQNTWMACSGRSPKRPCLKRPPTPKRFRPPCTVAVEESLVIPGRVSMVSRPQCCRLWCETSPAALRQQPLAAQYFVVRRPIGLMHRVRPELLYLLTMSLPPHRIPSYLRHLPVKVR